MTTLHHARRGASRPGHVAPLPDWPLTAPGMPPPGPNFLKAALAEGDGSVYRKVTRKGQTVVEYDPGAVLTDLYRRALREPGFTLPVQVRPGDDRPVAFIPGHIWGQYAAEWADHQADRHVVVPPVDGPRPAKVVVLGKMPWREEAKEFRNLVGASGEVLLDLIRRAHIRGAARWYITNLVKFFPPDESTRLLAGWIADCKPLLAMELRLVRPDYVLCLGADASKALLGNRFNVSYMDGRVVPLEFPVHRDAADEPEVHRCQVMTVLHPAEAAREPPKARQVARGIDRFALLTSGVNFDQAEKDLDHRVITTLEEAQAWAQEVSWELSHLPQARRLVAWDAEWQGQHPINPGSYLRTIQASWAPKHAACFKLRHAGGKVAFRDEAGRPALRRLMQLLQRFCRDKRAVGHFLVADLEWLRHAGFDPTRSCPVPLDPKGRKAAWARLRDGRGWLDTGAMAHAIEETASLGLEALAMRYTTVPRYDIPLEDWKKGFCKERKIKASALEGYGDCPDAILHPYANYDADATLRLAHALADLLDHDYNGNTCWEPCWETMIAMPVILEMHEHGIKVDRARIDPMTRAFITARGIQEEAIRDWAGWPEFNIRSTQHVKEFLFGYELNGKRDKQGKPVRIRPKGARTLALKPLLDTSKPPRRWEDLEHQGLTKQATPTTSRVVLGILAQDNRDREDQVNWVRYYRFLDQALKSVLRAPVVDDESDDGWLHEGEDDYLVYNAGLAACIDADGRVRTHFYPTAETGRWKSARPPMQNFSKQRDADYKKLLKEEYKHKLRSLLMAEDGFALVEFDYTGAELYGMAIMSGDAAMIAHAERALLPDEGYDQAGTRVKGGKFPHPDYYDIHSNIAVLAFKLKVTDHVYEQEDKAHPHYGKTAAQLLGLPVGAPCPANKAALKYIGKIHFRTLAKNVIFGVAYGRGAKAIAFQAREQGVDVSTDEAQAVIDTIFGTYPGLVPFFAEAKSRALGAQWLCHCFGRFRRFATAADFKSEGEFERQAMNFPIQGMVASAVNRGLARLQREIRRQGLQDGVRMLLQVHDAGVLEVRYDLIEHVTANLIPWAMRDCVPIYPSTLDGVPTGKGPYRLGLDISVEHHWSEKYTLEECRRLGIPERFAAA